MHAATAVISILHLPSEMHALKLVLLSPVDFSLVTTTWGKAVWLCHSELRNPYTEMLVPFSLRTWEGKFVTGACECCIYEDCFVLQHGVWLYCHAVIAIL